MDVLLINETLSVINVSLALSNPDNLGDALSFVKITSDTSGQSITKKVIKN